jgi:hypothetical protein
MALAYMQAGGRYDDPEYARVGDLPQAAMRTAVKSSPKRS